MKKKLISLLLTAVMATALLAGCGKEAEKEAAPAADDKAAVTESNDAEAEAPATEELPEVTITLGIYPEDTLVDDIAVFDGYIATYEEQHPNVTCVPAYYKYATDTFMPMVESGNCPTIFESWFTEPTKLIAQGAIADITDELEAKGWLDAMNPSIRDLLSDADGRVYGVPRDGYALGLMCNVELFEAAGLVDADGYPTLPETWNDVAEMGKKIKDATGSAGLCLLAENEAGGWHFSNIAWAFGATTLCKDNGDGTYTSNLASDEAIKAMEYVKSLKWDYDILTADPLSENWGTGFTQLGTGNAAMYIGANDAVAQPTQVNGLALDKFAMTAVPAADGGQYSLYGGTPYFFSKDATHDEIMAALDFLEVMGKAPVATEASVAGMRAGAEANANNGVPVIKGFPCWINQDYLDAQEEVVKEYSNVDPKLFQSYFDAAGSKGLHLEEPGDTQGMYRELTKVLQAVLTDKNADVAALMQQANENYQTILDTTFGE